jgi:hypothetical protein
MGHLEQLTQLSETVASILTIGVWGGAFLIGVSLVYLIMTLLGDGRND